MKLHAETMRKGDCSKTVNCEKQNPTQCLTDFNESKPDVSEDVGLSKYKLIFSLFAIRNLKIFFFRNLKFDF